MIEGDNVMDRIDLQFEVGQLIEARYFEKGYRSAWFQCKIDLGKSLLLEYCDYTEEKHEWKDIYQKVQGTHKKRSNKIELMVRPAFPRVYRQSEIPDCFPYSEVVVVVRDAWKVGDLVDWWKDGCFWSATIIEIVGDGTFLQLELPNPPNGEGGTYKDVLFKDLRPSLNWTVPSATEGEQSNCAWLIKPTNEASFSPTEIREREPLETNLSTKEIPTPLTNAKVLEMPTPVVDTKIQGMPTPGTQGEVQEMPTRVVKPKVQAMPTHVVKPKIPTPVVNAKVQEMPTRVTQAKVEEMLTLVMKAKPMEMPAPLMRTKADLDTKSSLPPQDGGKNHLGDAEEALQKRKVGYEGENHLGDAEEALKKRKVDDEGENHLGDAEEALKKRKVGDEGENHLGDVEEALKKRKVGDEGENHLGDAKEALMKRKVGDGVPFNTIPPESIEAAIVEMEELVNRIRWTKHILEFGMPSNSAPPSWNFMEPGVSSSHK